MKKLLSYLSIALASIFVVSCSGGGASPSPSPVDPTPSGHTHTFDYSVWAYDDEVHYHPATCGHNVRADEEEHDMHYDHQEEPTYDTDGYNVYSCSVCEYTIKEKYADKLEHHFSNKYIHDNKMHWHPCIDEGYEDVKSDVKQHQYRIEETTLDGIPGRYNICDTCGYYCLIDDNPIKTIDIYAVNDFHGTVLENYDSRYLGLVKFASYFKEKGENPNTLLMDQGDTWQGSIYSNYNYGNMINDVMSMAYFSSRTVGNHDFDWGTQRIIDNTARSYNGYNIPTLAANVYDYDLTTHKTGNIQQENIGRSSVTYTLENGIKVGIVGVIGSAQISSITSTYVKDLAFVDYIEIIKQEATKLREDGCDIVIASCHAGQDEVKGYGLSNYVDLVLCGHTHRYESSQENGTYFAQFGCYGQNFGHITLTYDTNQQDVTHTAVQTLSYYSLQSTTPNKEIEDFVNESIAGVDEEASQTMVVKATYFDRDCASNLMCRAILDKVNENNIEDVICSYTNVARKDIHSGAWTYADLYNAFPFDNMVYIAEVTGREIRDEMSNYNYVCLSDWFDGQINLNKKYKIAVIDYVLFHMNENRYYDYFPETRGNNLGVICEDNYRIILRDWLIKNGYNEGDKSLVASDFEGEPYLRNFSFHS